MSNKSLEIFSIEPKILTIRRVKVMIDRDLATLYGVETKRLNEAVKRNIGRFQSHYMFQLSRQEKQELVANCAISNAKQKSKITNLLFCI